MLGDDAEGGVSVKEPTIVMHQADTEKVVSHMTGPTGFAKYAGVSVRGCGITSSRDR